MTESKVAILGTPGYVRDPKRFSDEQIITVLGQNSGNLMFQYAASRIISSSQVHISLAEIPYSDFGALAGAKALVFPAANHLRLGADWTGLNGYLGACKLPLVILGLGAQSPKIGGESETIEALRNDPHITRMADILRDKAAFISVRGTYTQKVCEALGLHDVHILGCPSALINPDPHLGRNMAAKLAAIRSGDSDLRFAVTAAAPFEIHGDAPKRDLERRLFAWVTGANGLYVQQSGGIASMRAANGQWYAVDENPRKSIGKVMAPDMDPVDLGAFMVENARFYLSAPDWRDEMQVMDFCIGTRLHGNMAAISGGTPGIIIAHDSRTGELAQTMHLPRVTMEQAMQASDIRGLLAEVEFDGVAFDRWRAGAARTIIDEFARIGIPTSEYLGDLSRMIA